MAVKGQSPAFRLAVVGDDGRQQQWKHSAADRGGADMKAACRLFSAEGVTHVAVCQPHFELTRQSASRLPLVFLVQDTMVLNFTTHTHCQRLGPIGDGDTLRGLHRQNVLAIDPTTRRPLA